MLAGQTHRNEKIQETLRLTLSLSLDYNVKVLKWAHVDVELLLMESAFQRAACGPAAHAHAHDARPPNSEHLATSIIIQAMSHANC
jgi:hypothetical protein